MYVPYLGPIMLPIAAGSELKACTWSEKGKTFVAISGPCGAQHTMSLIEAESLKAWLECNLPKRPIYAWADVT